MRNATILMLGLLVVSACGRGGNEMRFLRTAEVTQAEASVTPAQPLAIPPTTALPSPTPGGSNRAEATPAR